MHGSRSKILVKNLVRLRCAEGFNSGVKGFGKVEQVRTSATYGHAGKNAKYPLLFLIASSWGVLLGAVFC
jgi:hypothetical protein